MKRHCASEFLRRHKVLSSAFDRDQPRDHLPGYGQRGTVAIASLLFLFVDQGQLVALPGCQLRTFDQHLLDVLAERLERLRTVPGVGHGNR